MATVKLALFQTKYSASIACEEWAAKHQEYVQLTEFEEIEFKPLPQDEIIKGRIAFIDEEIERITSESLTQINELKQRKQELLALEHQS